MNATILKTITFAIVFVIIFFTGYWLNRSGKPYQVILLNFHKLISLGMFIYLGLSVYRIHQATPIDALQVAIVGIACLCFITTIVTGGLVSIDKPFPAVLNVVHRVFPYLTLLSSGLVIYYLVFKA